MNTFEDWLKRVISEQATGNTITLDFKQIEGMVILTLQPADHGPVSYRVNMNEMTPWGKKP